MASTASKFTTPAASVRSARGMPRPTGMRFSSQTPRSRGWLVDDAHFQPQSGFGTAAGCRSARENAAGRPSFRHRTADTSTPLKGRSSNSWWLATTGSASKPPPPATPASWDRATGVNGSTTGTIFSARNSACRPTGPSSAWRSKTPTRTGPGPTRLVFPTRPEASMQLPPPPRSRSTGTPGWSSGWRGRPSVSVGRKAPAPPNPLTSRHQLIWSP